MVAINSIAQLIALSGDVVRWLFTWSWQALLLLGVAWVVIKLDRSRSATTRYRIWLITIIAVAALPLLGILSHSLRLPHSIAPPLFPAVDAGDAAAPAGVDSAARQAFSWASLIWPLSFASWVAGVIISLLRLGDSLWKLHRIRSRARPVSIADLGCSYSDLVPSGLDSVPLTLSESIQSPALAGLFRPVILLPADIVSWTSPEERASILRHEFAHVKRHDHIVSLLQSALRALLFFHPMLRYACSQLSLEREIACDDHVLSLGTEPNAYAESILKAAERSFLTDVVHQTASFASRRKLERRIDMILDPGRVRQPMRQWHFLLLPVMLIATVTWLVIPAASSQPSLQTANSDLTPEGAASPRPAPPDFRDAQASPVVDKATIWVDSVKRGTMLLQARGVGVLLPADNGRLKAQLEVAEPQAKNIQIGQPASIDTRNGIVSGRVNGINARVINGMVGVDVSLEGDPPGGVKAGLRVDGIIEFGRLDDVLYVGRPVQGERSNTSSLFKIDEGGKAATRVRVRFGRSSVNTIEIIEGLEEGDRVIISDMSQYDGVDRIRLN